MLRVKKAGHTGHTPRKMECSTWLRQQNVGNRINMNQLRSPIIWIVNTHTEVSQLWLEQQSAGPYPTESSRPMQFGSSKFRVWTFSLTAPSHEADTKLKHGTACGMAFGKAPFVDRPDEHPRGSSRLHEQNMHCCGHVYPAACHFRQEFTWGGRSRWTYMGGITFQRVQTGVPVRLIFSREGIPCRVCFPRSERPVLLPQWAFDRWVPLSAFDEASRLQALLVRRDVVPCGLRSTDTHGLCGRQRREWCHWRKWPRQRLRMPGLLRFRTGEAWRTNTYKCIKKREARKEGRFFECLLCHFPRSSNNCSEQ